eukprot:4374335-Prymnesium_polylepis.2
MVRRMGSGSAGRAQKALGESERRVTDGGLGAAAECIGNPPGGGALGGAACITEPHDVSVREKHVPVGAKHLEGRATKKSTGVGCGGSGARAVRQHIR